LRKRAKDTYLRRLKEFFDELEAVEFCILVWGSGKENEEHFNKRRTIYNHLAEKFSCVIMSEDEAFQEDVETYGLEAAEAAQAKKADAIVVLDTSIGPHTEIAMFAGIMREDNKTIVFAAEEFTNSTGFAATPFKLLKVESYMPEEYEDCTQIRKAATEHCINLRWEKAKKEGFPYR